jgi:lysozyme family protein
MPQVSFTQALRGEYQSLFDQCQVNPQKAPEVERLVASLIAHRMRYESVGNRVSVPWEVVAVIHNMECGQNFSEHLHNGDPLTARTVHVPVGRPVSGEPPFEWEDSAVDALGRISRWSDWSVPGILYCLEGYNGWGYRLWHPEVKSPYLWAGSNQYTSGKYVKDGTWSPSAVSAQCGAATLLRRLAENGELDAEPHVADDDPYSTFQKKAAFFSYSPGRTTPGGVELQHFLNGFPGVYLKEDGRLGDRTSDACRQVFGRYLSGDPRERIDQGSRK